MTTKDAYKQKIEAELELVKANLDVLKAKAKSTTADIRISYYKEIETLQNDYSVVQAKLNELSNESWEHLKEEMKDSWDSLHTYTKKIPDNVSQIKKDIK